MVSSKLLNKVNHHKVDDPDDTAERADSGLDDKVS